MSDVFCGGPPHTLMIHGYMKIRLAEVFLISENITECNEQ